MVGPNQQLEAEILEELDVFLEVPDDQFDMVDAFNHRSLPS